MRARLLRAALMLLAIASGCDSAYARGFLWGRRSASAAGIAFVHATSGLSTAYGGSAPTTATINIPASTVGNLLIACTEGDVVNAITDDGSNTWAVLYQHPSYQLVPMKIWTALTTGVATVVTIHDTLGYSTSQIGMLVLEYSGLTNTLDQSTASHAFASTTAAGSLTPSVASVYVGFVDSQTTQTSYTGSGALISRTPQTGGLDIQAWADGVVAAGTAYNASWNLSGAGTNDQMAITVY